MAGLQPTVIWLNAFLMALTFTALCARVGRRIFVVRTFNWHDGLILLAAISAFIFSICQIVGTSLGLGQHQDLVDPNDMTKLYKLILASNTFYFLCNWAVKHALLLFYSELVREKSYTYSIFFMHFVALGFGLSSILVNIFQCTPVARAWDPNVPGWCVNFDLFLRFNAPIMLATDLVLYAMPVVFTWNLQLRRQQRIGLNFLFSLGGLVLAASTVRIYSIHKVATEPDFTWWFAHAMIWSVLENHLAIAVACAPSVKVIALLLFPRLASSLSKLVSSATTRSRSRSRSAPSGASYATDDLESGTAGLGKGSRKGSGASGKDVYAMSSSPATGEHGRDAKLKLTPVSTPMPSPALSQASRTSRNFARWFNSPLSPRSPRSPRWPGGAALHSTDSMEGGLVGVDEEGTEAMSPGSWKEENVRMETWRGNGGGENDIRVEHTITVEERERGGSYDREAAKGLGRAL
ncbi:uncharacterized protein EI97DRAFT_198234 [Westerdykella ornata]|uniref:Rhodopsin domain-containing protein n=1 Tax=Westerdykella ornata TaxID=318751 RepID=A0A6A6JAQ8_WESOR|nr:uncharacterized protein EI97DRAFT_198234 [Westerdykella ornata]KAF2272706.1 hypothetical protein EI97DRAFT_198234 [Westerdykella ornata]